MYFVERLLMFFKIRSLSQKIFILFLTVFFQPYLITAHKNHNKHEIGKLEKPKILYPTLENSDFLPPKVGTYNLPKIKRAGNGSIIDRNERSHNLSDLLKDKVTLLSFIYTTCSDQQGCPLATSVLKQVASKINEFDFETKKYLQIISLSFDPERDTPQVMDAYGKIFSKNNYWRFLTTKNRKELKIILNNYDQSILQETNENGDRIGSISHILRIFLIDKELNIRNIYSVSFMKPEMITNDIITLLNEKKSKKLFSKNKKTIKNNSLHGAGDKKKGYEDPSYKTFSKSLESRKGRYSKSYEEFKHNNLGLPEQGGINSLTYLQINLGKKLFFDRRISLNDTISCAICHIPEQGFTSHELATPVGFEGRSLRRNAPTLYNVSFNKLFFHDGREYSLDNQVWSPLLKSNEMANPSIGYVIKKLKKLDDYNILFQKAYNGEEPNVSNIGHAFASYLKTLSSGNSPFDQWFYGKEENAITNKAKSGFKIFTGKGLCSTCHTIGQNHALFTDHKLHNTGLGFARSMGIDPFKNKLQVAPGVFITVSQNLFDSLSRESVNDLGFYEVTQNPQDRWKYKTPTLRNITLTPPYMHDGSIGDLKNVIEFYDKGGIQNENIDPLIRPLGLSKNEKDNLLEFLKTLEGDNIENLISDAFSQSIGDR